MIDPLDGTMNYAHRYPIFSVSIAFKAHGVTEWGGVFVPALNEMYSAIRGRGAYLGERELRVSTIDELSDALITTGFPTTKATDPDHNILEVTAVLPLSGPARSGSAAFDLAQVAAAALTASGNTGRTNGISRGSASGDGPVGRSVSCVNRVRRRRSRIRRHERRVHAALMEHLKAALA